MNEPGCKALIHNKDFNPLYVYLRNPVTGEVKPLKGITTMEAGFVYAPYKPLNLPPIVDRLGYKNYLVQGF